MHDFVPTRSTGINDSLMAVVGSVQALTAWTDPEGHAMLASSGGDGTIRIWDAITGAEVGVPLRGSSSFTGLITYVDPDGHVILASGDDRAIRRWDTTTGAELRSLLKGPSWITALASWVGVDGNVILASSSSGSTIRRWDVITDAEIGAPLDADTDWSLALTTSITSDGRVFLASISSDGRIRRWNATTGALEDSYNAGRRLVPDHYSVAALVANVGTDARPMLVSGGRHGIRRWDATTGAPIGKPLKGHTGGVQALATWVGPRRQVLLASGGRDGTIRRWDATTGASIGTPLTGHTASVSAVTAWTSSDGYPMLASAATPDGLIRRWNGLAAIPVGEPLADAVSAPKALTAWTGPDGRTVLASIDPSGMIRTWDADAGSPLGKPLSRHRRLGRRRLGTGTVLTAWTGRDDHMMLASGDYNKIVLWDATKGSQVGKPLRHRPRFRPWGGDSVEGLTAWTGPDGAILASTNFGGVIQCWDPTTGTPIGKPLPGENYAFNRAMAVWTTPNGFMVAAPDHTGRAIQRWDAASGDPVGDPLPGHAGRVAAMTAWTDPDNNVMLAAADYEGVIRRWDAASGEPGGDPLPAYAGPVASMTAWTGADNHVMLASGGRDGMIRVWDITTGALLSRVLVEPIRLRGLADRPAKHDLLGRTALTQALANLLLWRPTTAGGEPGPGVVTVEGPWGSGKTTIMRLIEDRITAKPERAHTRRRHLSVAAARKILRQAKNLDAADINTTPTQYRGALTAWFNPWVCQSSEQVWAGIARAVTDAARPVLYPIDGVPQAQSYWLTRNAARIDRFAISRSLLFRTLSPLLGFGTVIAIATILINLAKLNSNTLFHVLHWRITPSVLALALALLFLLAGLVHTVIRYYGPVDTYLPTDVVRGPVLSSSFSDDDGEAAKVLHDPVYLAKSGYLPIVQADTERTIRDLREAGYDLVVFIDDLDRCSARTTAEVFEAINLFLSDTTDLAAKFVIGLDPAVIAAHLDSIYKQLDNVQFLQYGDDPSPGWAFLRKVVQLPVGAPRVTDPATEQFLGAALAIQTTAANHVTDTTGAEAPAVTRNRNANSRQSATEARHPRTVSEISHEAKLRTGSLEHQPEIVKLMKQRLINQPERSAREAKRMLNIWQLYQRVLDLSNPMRDEEEVVRRARHLVILAEIITRWPALQRQLHGSFDGARGLQVLAKACNNDEEWTSALAVVGLNEKEHNRAVANIRALLRKYNGLAIADLAAKVL